MAVTTSRKQQPKKPVEGEIDFALIWIGIVKGLELMRQQTIDRMVASGEIDPDKIAGLFESNLDLMVGRTFEQRFSSFVGWLSAGRFPQFVKWWKLLNRHERLAWRMRHNLGGSANPHRIEAAVNS